MGLGFGIHTSDGGKDSLASSLISQRIAQLKE